MILAIREALLALCLFGCDSGANKSAGNGNAKTSNTIKTSSTPAPTSSTVAVSVKTTSTTPVTLSTSTTKSIGTRAASATFSLPAATPTTTSLPPNLARGVNVGGWLILEPWMNQAVIGSSGAIDQLTFDSTPSAASKLQNHWATYFTQADVAFIAGYGMNAIRIPIGFWAFDNSGTNFLPGAQNYLDQAIGWARAYGLKVLIDIHGSPGSQNGWDHSGDASGPAWQVGSNLTALGFNMQRHIQVLQQVAAKYGSASLADVVFAIEIANEPISWAPNDFSVTKNWAAVAYNAMMVYVTNPYLQILVHDGFMGPQSWYDIASAINGNLPTSQFAIDVHLYQNMVASDSSINMTAHIQKACNWGNAARDPLLPVFVGEFSAAVNICVNPDGSTFGNDGTQSCTVTGCQCTDSVSIDQWSPALKNVTRMYWEAQLQSFEHANSGYFLWSINGFGGWAMKDLYKYGIIGKTIYERVYGNQCTYTV